MQQPVTVGTTVCSLQVCISWVDPQVDLGCIDCDKCATKNCKAFVRCDYVDLFHQPPRRCVDICRPHRDKQR